jgi:hypothetical protein
MLRIIPATPAKNPRNIPQVANRAISIMHVQSLANPYCDKVSNHPAGGSCGQPSKYRDQDVHGFASSDSLLRKNRLESVKLF